MSPTLAAMGVHRPGFAAVAAEAAFAVRTRLLGQSRSRFSGRSCPECFTTGESLSVPATPWRTDAGPGPRSWRPSPYPRPSDAVPRRGDRCREPVHGRPERLTDVTVQFAGTPQTPPSSDPSRHADHPGALPERHFARPGRAISPGSPPRHHNPHLPTPPARSWTPASSTKPRHRTRPGQLHQAAPPDPPRPAPPSRATAPARQIPTPRRNPPGAPRRLCRTRVM